MNFADNRARFFVVIRFLTFEEAKIIRRIVHKLIALGLFLGAIAYFALTGKKLKCLTRKIRTKAITNKLN